MERVALPDAAIGTDYLLHLTAGLIRSAVDEARMREPRPTGGLIYSGEVLLELVAPGSRGKTRTPFQAAAMDTWDTGMPFRDTLRKQAATRGCRFARTG